MADYPSYQFPVTVTHQDIAAGLRKAGLAADDMVIVHSSLSAFGKVEGGANAVIDGILDAAGPKGTVVFPAFVGVHIDLIDTPLDQMKIYTGSIPATARARKEFRHGTHPFYDIAATGPHAQELIDLNNIYAFPSAKMKFMYRMGELGGKVLLLGVGHESNSAIHMVEEFSEVEYKVQDHEWWTLTCAEFLKLPRARQWHIANRHCGYTMPYSPCVHLNAIDAPLRRIGAIQTVRIGRAQCHLMKIADILKVGAEESARDPWFLCDKVMKAPE